MEKVVEFVDDRVPTEEHKALEILVVNEERLRSEQLRFVTSSRSGRDGLQCKATETVAMEVDVVG